jgi:ATP-binding cassette, subfamily B, bacterial
MTSPAPLQQPSASPRPALSMAAAIKPLVDPSARRGIAGLALASAIGGLVEAVALVLISTGAIAISRRDATVSLLGRSLATSNALLYAAILLVLRFGFSVLAGRLTAVISSRSYLRLTERLVSSYLHTGWGTRSSDRVGELQYLVGSSAMQASNTVLYVGQAIVTAFSLVVLLVVSLTLNPIAVLVMAVTGVGLFLALKPLARKGRTLSAALNVAQREFGTLTTETTKVSREITTFEVTDEVGQDIHSKLASIVRLMERQRLVNLLSPTLYQTMLFGATIAFLAIIKHTNGQTAVLAGIVILLLRALTYGQSLQFVYHNMQSTLPVIDEVVERIERFEADIPTYGGSTLGPVRSIALEAVDFTYPNGTQALSGATVRVQPGEAIGVIGPSGGGKSTMVQMLLRLRAPTTGHLTINGEEATSFTAQSFAARVAFVPQDPQLIAGTVADNVRFFRRFDDSAVRDACRAAQVEDEILRLPKGYDTPVGEGGGHFSVGQKQRLCIARALVGKPDLLILDEPTAALDALSESRIQQMLHSLHGTVMMVIVAHRLTTIQACDRVVVLESGIVRAFDSFSKLAGTNHFFDEAVRLSTLHT